MTKLLEQVVSKTIPDGYVYKTTSGSYFHSEGSWLNGKTLQMIPESKNARMNHAALQQIAEHNESSSLQIGKKYALKEGTYMYIGNGTFTKNGQYLSETERKSTLKYLTESTTLLEIPPGYLLDVPKEDSEYLRGTDGKWTSTGGHSPDEKHSTELDIKALEEINRLNRHNDYQIGDAVEFNNKEYAYVGDAFVEVGTSHRIPDQSKLAKVLYDKYSERENYPYYDNGSDGELKEILKKKKESIGLSTEDDTKSKTKSPEDEHVVDTSASDKSTEQEVVPDEPEAQDDKQDLEDQPAPKDADKADEKPEQDDKPVDEPAANTDSASPSTTAANSSVLPDEDKEISETDVSPKVPNGYVTTSKSGKRYVKRKNAWYDEQTNKVLNSSASSMVERAAAAAIKKYNKENEGKAIPIGQEYTSNSGTVFTWNGTTFVDSKGRILPKTALGSVLPKVKAQLGLDGNKPEDTQSADADSAASEDEVKPDSEKNKASVTDINRDRLQQGPAANDAEEDPLKPANDDIDFDEEVPPEDNSEEKKKDEPASTDDNASTTDSSSSPDLSRTEGEAEDEYLKRIADAIKKNPESRRITVLLGRGDPVSLIAADILLNGQQKEARDIINTLNTDSGNQ